MVQPTMENHLRLISVHEITETRDEAQCVIYVVTPPFQPVGKSNAPLAPPTWWQEKIP